MTELQLEQNIAATPTIIV